MTDKIEKIDQALVHHGKFSDRLYILKFPIDGKSGLVKAIIERSIENGYSKIVGKVPKTKLPLFLRNGFKMEAAIPRFYKGLGDCCFVSRFLDLNRAVFDPEPMEAFNQVLDNYHLINSDNDKHDFDIQELSIDHADRVAEVYRQVFDTYPFPIHDPVYIRHTMKNDVLYFGVFIENDLCSISSSEMDVKNQNAEMTDFAVLDKARGKGMSKILLRYMEEDMKKKNMKTLYTIARLNSIPMNKAFLGAGYSYAGTLVNNTNIAGGIESMNVLYKYI